jgi:hypothetical protein
MYIDMLRATYKEETGKDAMVNGQLTSEYAEWLEQKLMDDVLYSSD